MKSEVILDFMKNVRLHNVCIQINFYKNRFMIRSRRKRLAKISQLLVIQFLLLNVEDLTFQVIDMKTLYFHVNLLTYKNLFFTILIFMIYQNLFRIFAREEEEILAYKSRIDNVVSKAVKESLIQVIFSLLLFSIFTTFSLS